MYGRRANSGIHHDSDFISDHLSPASLDPPFSTPNPSWDPMPLYKDLQDDYKIRDMNRVALLERNYCSNFFCCDIRLSGFHELLEHIEDAHFVLTNDKNGNKRFLYQPVGVSSVAPQQQQPEESCCPPFDAGCEFEFEFDRNGYTDPFAFGGYYEDDESRLSSPSPSPSPTISSSSSSASSPVTSPLLLPTRAPASAASPSPSVPKTSAPTSHVSSPSSSPSPASIPLIAPIPSRPIHYDPVVHEDHYNHESKGTASTSKARWKQLSGSHHTTSTITAAAAGTGFRKRGSNPGDREKLYRCPTAGCKKAYLNPNGLKYHREKGKCSFEEDAIVTRILR